MEEAVTEEEFADIYEFGEENDRICGEEVEETVDEQFSVCICDFPSAEDLVCCSNKDCTIGIYFHKSCVGLDAGSDCKDWLCETCRSTTSRELPASGSTSIATSSSCITETEREGKMKYPKRRFNKEEAKRHSRTFLDSALDSVFSDPIFQMDTPLVQQTKQLAAKLVAQKGESKVEHFFEKVTGKLWKKVVSEVRGKSWTEEAKLSMWHHFHVLRTKPALRSKWKKLLDEVGIERNVREEIFLFQHLIEKILQQLLQAMMKMDMPEEEVVVQVSELSRSEEQALRYCVGYVPVKLKRRYSKITNNETSKQFLDFLKGWAMLEEDVTGHSLKDFTLHWMNVQDRGGLFRVNDEVYSFFKAVESCIRSIIHVKNIKALQHVDIQEMLCMKLDKDHAVKQKWHDIAKSLPPEANQKLFEEVLKCFVKMRCEAFVRVYLLIRKEMDAKTSKKGERGLRKELATEERV